MAASHSQQGPASALSRADRLRSLLAHNQLYDDIDANHPEGDVRLRFLGLRTERAQFIEGKVKQHERVYQGLKEKVKNGELDLDSEEVQDRIEEALLDVDKYLDWSSRALEQDSKAADAPVVDPVFMDNVFRWYLEPSKNGARAPNGEPSSLYGSYGDAVSPYFTTPRGCDNDLLRSVILNRLLRPFDERVYQPCRKRYNGWLRREHQEAAYGLSDRTLELVVSALECMLAVLCVSGSVILLYNLNSTKDRLIAGTFLSLAFPYPVIFLSKEAMRIFALTAAYWAVMVVFMSTSSYGSRNN